MIFEEESLQDKGFDSSEVTQLVVWLVEILHFLHNHRPFRTGDKSLPGDEPLGVI